MDHLAQSNLVLVTEGWAMAVMVHLRKKKTLRLSKNKIRYINPEEKTMGDMNK
jgi:hypothetical protein